MWVLSRSEAMRFITKIYAGAMNVPAFIWDIIPYIPIESKDDSDVYRILGINSSEIKIIKECLDDKNSKSVKKSKSAFKSKSKRKTVSISKSRNELKSREKFRKSVKKSKKRSSH